MGVQFYFADTKLRKRKKFCNVIIPTLCCYFSQIFVGRFLFYSNCFTFATLFIRDVAQPGSAHVWGAWGRKFKSCRPD